MATSLGKLQTAERPLADAFHQLKEYSEIARTAEVAIQVPKK